MSFNLRKRDVSSAVFEFLRAQLASEIHIGSIGDFYFVAGSSTAYYTQLLNMGVPSDKLLTTLASAYAAVTDGNNDVIIVFPGGNDLGSSAVTWSKGYFSVIGAVPKAHAGGRARITTGNINAATALTISGQGVFLKNLNIQWGNNNASALTALAITYSGNTGFVAEDCMFEGPTNATEGAAAFKLVNVAAHAQDTTFRNCFFGGWTIQANQAPGHLLYIDVDTARVKVENSEFMSASTDATHTPIFVNTGSSLNFTHFKDCLFLNSVNATQLNNVCGGAALSEGYVIFQNCGTNAKAFGAATPSIRLIPQATDKTSGIAVATS
jgi:hypothetical protein